MFRTVKRIIDWCGEYKGKLYLGFVMTFLSHVFTALPIGLAAYTVGLLIESKTGGASFDDLCSFVSCSIISAQGFRSRSATSSRRVTDLRSVTQ